MSLSLTTFSFSSPDAVPTNDNNGTALASAAVSVILPRKTDQQLEAVLARVAYSVGEKAAGELDLRWLSGDLSRRPS